MSENNNNNKNQLQIELPQEVAQGEYANFAIITHSSSDFIIDFGDAVAQAEGSWSTFSSGEIPTGPIIYGSEGTIVCDRFTNVVKVYKTFKPYVQTPPPEEAITPEPMPNLNLARQLIDFIREIEKQTKKTAKLDLLPLQAGDVYRTWADTAKLKRDYGFAPSVPLSEGVRAFVEWYRAFYGV